MTRGLPTPVVLVIFDRPELTARVAAAIAAARPKHLIVLADGPRAGCPDDLERVAAARAAVDAIAWPGRVDRVYRPENVGCNAQFESGLDEVFAAVDRAIIVEDDVLAHPHFFAWCDAMLDRYDGHHAVQQISGRNELGRWDAGGRDHFVARRGSIWGWATWAHSFCAVRRAGISDVDDNLLTGFDPLLAEHVRYQQSLDNADRRTTWDHRWNTARMLRGGVSVIAPVNLVANLGFGVGATHTMAGTDVRGVLGPIDPDDPSGGPGDDGAGVVIDDTYDHWSLLFELMAAYQRPAVVRRLARNPALARSAGWSDPAGVAHHLRPFDEPATAAVVIDHVRRHAGTTPLLEELAAVMHRAAHEYLQVQR